MNEGMIPRLFLCRAFLPAAVLKQTSPHLRASRHRSAKIALIKDIQTHFFSSCIITLNQSFQVSRRCNEPMSIFCYRDYEPHRLSILCFLSLMSNSLSPQNNGGLSTTSDCSTSTRCLAIIYILQSLASIPIKKTLRDRLDTKTGCSVLNRAHVTSLPPCSLKADGQNHRPVAA